MATSPERTAELRQNLVATPGFAAIDGLSGPEQQHEAILDLLETSVIASDSDASAAYVLWAGKSEHYYPKWSEPQATNHLREKTKYEGIINHDTVSYLLEARDRNDQRVRRLIRTLIPQYLEIQLGELKKEIDTHRTTEDFWREIRQESNGQQVIDYLNQLEGENLWQKFMGFRTPFLQGLSSPENIAWETKIFDTVEREAGKQDAEILFKTIELLHELGFQSVDEYLTLMMGENPSVIGQQLEEMQKVFHALPDRKTERKLYMKRQQEALAGINLTDTPDNPLLLVEQSLAELGIDKDAWTNEVGLVTDLNPEIATAYYVLLPFLPRFAGNYEGLSESPLWKLLQNHRIVIMTPGEFQKTEDYRLLFHEEGHALEASLRLLQDKQNGRPPGSSLTGRPMTLNEVFSLFHEGRMPQQDYFKARERFLTARFVGLSQHEFTIWREAEKVVNAQEKDKNRANRRFFNTINVSYKETLGKAVSAIVPTGRSLRDFFSPTNPGIASSYAFGMLIAASLREKIAQTDGAEEKKRILQTVADATTQRETVIDVLEQMGVSWKQAKENLHNLFSLTV